VEPGLAIRREEAGGVVRNAQPLAEVFDDGLRLAELIARHGREQVMLDLVVEAAVPEVGDPVPEDVA